MARIYAKIMMLSSSVQFSSFIDDFTLGDVKETSIIICVKMALWMYNYK